jgi:hypothetical protein
VIRLIQVQSQVAAEHLEYLPELVKDVPILVERFEDSATVNQCIAHDFKVISRVLPFWVIELIG